MRSRLAAALFAALTLIGCAAVGPATDAQTPPPASPPPPAAPARAAPALPLILDRTDLRIGMTVEFARLPGAEEISDLRQMPALAHVVLALPEWPAEYEGLMVLEQLPPETDVIVVLPGYPPSRAAAEAWNLLQAPLRIVLLVAGPPPSVGVVADLNGMRGLERVIVDADYPSRSGFERLQRPISFRKVVP